MGEVKLTPEYYEFFHANFAGVLNTKQWQIAKQFYTAGAAHYATIGDFWAAGGYHNQALTKAVFDAGNSDEASGLGLGDMGVGVCDYTPVINDETKALWQKAANSAIRSPYAVADALNKAASAAQDQYDHSKSLPQVPGYDSVPNQITAICEIENGNGGCVKYNYDTRYQTGYAHVSKTQDGGMVLFPDQLKQCMQSQSAATTADD